MDKHKEFIEELDRIKDEEIRRFTEECLNRSPSHFWYRPASSTGKYHSPEENEVGGLILHTKRVCSAAEILIDAWMEPIDKEIIRSACILHDICKYGTGSSSTRWTLSNHPQLGSNFLREVGRDKYDQSKVNAIANAVAFHSGRWGKTFEKKDENHLADVVATKLYEEASIWRKNLTKESTRQDEDIRVV